jgi:alkyl hydroperoxide reductase subunit F
MANIEVYSKAWCPYCAKAKALLKAKELPFTEIDVTHDRDLQRVMIERSGRRTVPQIFIDGEAIGGYDDLASLNATGELDRKLGRGAAEIKTIYDVAVIGGGPAGLTAAMYAARKNLSTIIVTLDIGGQVGITAEVANYPGFDSITGPELMQRFHEQAVRYGVEQLIGEKVVGLRMEGRSKVLELASGRALRAKSLIVASGVQKKRLDVPGEKELFGRGVVYCSTCDGPLFKDLTIAVIGAGNSALEAVIEMNGIARKVYWVHRGASEADAILIDRVHACERVEAVRGVQPIAILGDNAVTGLVVRDLESEAERHLDVDGVFIEIGLFPNTEFALDLLETNERGEINVDPHGNTGVRGIFAAGDATNSHDKQIIIAAGEGAKAALAAFEYLVTQV